MTRRLRSGAAAVVVAGATLICVEGPAAATNLICLNAQHQFVDCPQGTVPAIPYHAPAASTSPSTAAVTPAPAPASAASTAPAGAASTAPAKSGAQPLRAAGSSRSGHGSSVVRPLLLAIDVVMSAAVTIGLGLQLRRRRRLAAR